MRSLSAYNSSLEVIFDSNSYFSTCSHFVQEDGAPFEQPERYMLSNLGDVLVDVMEVLGTCLSQHIVLKQFINAQRSGKQERIEF
jgi:hypothetical protein